MKHLLMKVSYKLDILQKLADFTVLEQDPYAVEPQHFGDIPIWGTVVGGRPYPRVSP